jgi:hypothetical protein
VNASSVIIPLITVVLSSSIVGTILTTSFSGIMDSMSQPEFKISTYEVHEDIHVGMNGTLLSEPNTQNDIQLLEIEISNVGEEAATNIFAAFDLHDEFRVEEVNVLYSKNQTSIDPLYSDVFYLNVSKIQSGETVTMMALVNFNYFGTPTTLFDYFSNQYGSIFKYFEKVSMRYDQGFDQFILYENEFPKFFLILIQFSPIFILLAALSTIYIYYKYRQKQNFENFRNNLSIIHKIQYLLLKVNKAFFADMNSKSIFDYRFWFQENYDNKRRVFDDYDHYKIVNNLSNLLSQREFECLKEEIDYVKLVNYNRKCYELSQKGLESIDWKKWNDDYINLYPSLFWIFRFSIFSLGITLIELSLYITFGALSNWSLLHRTDSTIIIVLMFIAVSRIIGYYYLLMRSIGHLVRQIDITIQINVFKNISRRNKGLIVFVSSLTIGIPSIFLAVLITLPLLAREIAANDYELIFLLFPLVLCIDMLRVNALSYYISKKLILKRNKSSYFD